MTQNRLSVALALALGAAALYQLGCQEGCKTPKPVPAEPSEASLRPYDFRGHTRPKLRRLCEGASLLAGGEAARRHLRCGRVLLDWFLLGVLREDAELLEGLEKFLGLAATKGEASATGARLLEAIGKRFQKAATKGRGGSFSRLALAGLALVELQRVESPRWGYAYLEGLKEASRVGAPFETQARVIIAGASMDGLKTAAKAAPHQRSLVFVQGLGFACPVEAEMNRYSQDSPDSQDSLGSLDSQNSLDSQDQSEREPSCPMACSELRTRMRQVAPERRKGLIAAQCPLSHLGLSHREHGVYLSQENLLVTRSLAFQIENLQRLSVLASDQPLLDALQGALTTLGRRLEEVRIPLALPELSPGEAVHFPLPLCPSAEEPVTAPVVLALDETRLFGGTVPVVAVRKGEITFLDWREGLIFPGRPLQVADASSMRQELRQLHQTYRRILGKKAPLHRDRVAIYAASSLSTGRLADLLDVLVQLGVFKAELVLRNSEGLIRAVPVELARRRRGEGPPLFAPEPPIDPQKAPLQLDLGARTLQLRAARGPLAVSPLRIAAGDLAGLRETLEKTRREYRDVSGVEIRLDHAVPYADLARLLHHLRRNSSGRTLHTTLIL